MSSETAISRWLQAEMPRRGYPIGGPRAGGISRLAEDAGIPQASMSRIVNGRAEPGVEHLRKIGKVFSVPLNELLIHAEMADESDFTFRTILSPGSPDEGAAQQVDVPHDVPIEDLDGYQQHLWFTPDMTVEQREKLVSFARLLRTDMPGEADRLAAMIGVLRALVGDEAPGATVRR